MSVRTALSVVQEFRRGVNLSVPTTITSLTDPDELQLVEHMNQVCEYLRRRGPFRQQVRSYTFNTADATSTYSLPGDYWAPLPLTHYNRTTDRRLVGPLTDGEWQEYTEGFGATPYEYLWRIAGYDSSLSGVEGRLFEVYPTPSAVESLTFEYISGNLYLPTGWFASPDTAIHETIAADTDYCQFDADLVKLGLKWKYMDDTNSDRNAVQMAKSEFDREITKNRMRWHGITSTTGRRKYFGTDRTRPYITNQSWSWT